jgi:hypothetical protein
MQFAGTRVILEKERVDGLLIVPNGVIGTVIDRIPQGCGRAPGAYRTSERFGGRTRGPVVVWAGRI